jgi:hypothetical protein
MRASTCVVTGPGVKPDVKRTHLIDLFVSAAACKAVYAGSIPTPASKRRYDERYPSPDLSIGYCLRREKPSPARPSPSNASVPGSGMV